MIELRKIAVPERSVEGSIKSPAGTAELLGPRRVPGGGWHHVMYRDSKGATPRPIPFVYCPKCGIGGYLPEHTIDGNGNVTPSMVCSFEGCKFHDNVRLMGWEA